MAFDLKKSEKFSIAQTADMVLCDPDTGAELFDPSLGEEDGKVVFTLVSTANPKHQRAVDKLTKARNKFGKRDPTPEETREMSMQFIADLSVSVENMEWNGQKIDNAEVFKEMYSDKEYSWIGEQVTAFLGTSTNFIKA